MPKVYLVEYGNIYEGPYGNAGLYSDEKQALAALKIQRQKNENDKSAHLYAEIVELELK